MRRLYVKLWIALAMLGLVTAGTACPSERDGPATAPAVAGGAAPERVRIGTYDPRAVAVAYAPSEFQRRHMAELMEERNKAKAAGDQKRVERLEQQGSFEQRRLHPLLLQLCLAAQPCAVGCSCDLVEAPGVHAACCWCAGVVATSAVAAAQP